MQGDKVEAGADKNTTCAEGNFKKPRTGEGPGYMQGRQEGSGCKPPNGEGSQGRS